MVVLVALGPLLAPDPAIAMAGPAKTVAAQAGTAQAAAAEAAAAAEVSAPEVARAEAPAGVATEVVVAGGLAGAACGPVVADPLAEAPWALARLRPELAWPLSTGAGVTVAVIDSGVSSDHPSLAGKVLPGNDLVTPGPGGCDENGHGTLIAGIIAGREVISNGFRFYGVAPDANIVPVRVLRDQQRTFEEGISARIATAIRWAIDAGGARVINLSLTTLPSPELEAAVRYGLERGVVMVAAAGNEGATGEREFPAAYEGVIAVAGTGPDDLQANTSTVGSYVDIAAPGTRISGPAPAGRGFLFSEAGGTSFATAYVSGVAALIRSYDPALTPQQVRERIELTADHPADMWNSAVGHGIINPQRAVGVLRPASQPAGVTPGRLDVRPVGQDPLREVTLIAGWVTLAGAAIAVAILVIRPLWRRGRQRGWLPSRSR
jgi:membrane-anchored mycosin MYCP